MDFGTQIIKKIMNNRGQKVEPCGTPDSMDKGGEDSQKRGQWKIWIVN
jgi:hypothetical protein